MKEFLEALSDPTNFYIDRSPEIQELSDFLGTTEGWIEATRRQNSGGFSSVGFISAICDAWIIYCHAMLHDDLRSKAETYFSYFKKSLLNPEIWAALESQERFYSVEKDRLERRFPEAMLLDPDLLFEERKLETQIKEGCLLQFWSTKRSNSEEACRVLRNHYSRDAIIRAAIDMDGAFFVNLSNCIQNDYTSSPAKAIEELIKMPDSSTDSKTKAWIRRYWVSRCLWLMDDLALLKVVPRMKKSTITKTRVLEDGLTVRKHHDDLRSSNRPTLKWKMDVGWDVPLGGRDTFPNWRFLVHDAPN